MRLYHIYFICMLAPVSAETLASGRDQIRKMIDGYQTRKAAGQWTVRNRGAMRGLSTVSDTAPGSYPRLTLLTNFGSVAVPNSPLLVSAYITGDVPFRAVLFSEATEDNPGLPAKLLELKSVPEGLPFLVGPFSPQTFPTSLNLSGGSIVPVTSVTPSPEFGGMPRISFRVFLVDVEKNEIVEDVSTSVGIGFAAGGYSLNAAVLRDKLILSGALPPNHVIGFLDGSGHFSFSGFGELSLSSSDLVVYDLSHLCKGNDQLLRINLVDLSGLVLNTALITNFGSCDTSTPQRSSAVLSGGTQKR